MSKWGNSGKRSRTNGWDALRDVLIASLNKGQFPLAIFGLIVLVSVYRLPSEDVGKFVFSVLAGLENGYLTGYALFLLSVAGWFFHAKRQRSAMTGEIKRIAAARTKLQENALAKKLKSSENK